ncbi:MAG: ABC transporter ATP-binding protein [Chloroflexota bacterium]
MASEIRLEKLRREFGPTIAVDDISITFPSSSVTCLLGPSGCGKTTLMRMIAGLQEPTSGEIYFGDQNVTDLTPSQRNIGMVFQYPVVYRGTTVFSSVELPLRQQRISAKERKQRVTETLESLDLMDVAYEPVAELNNATRQKAAVARAVARQPQIILFDEPITNVDVSAKVQLKRALKGLVKQHAQTIIYVTHDQTEAMTLADEIALMQSGKIIQRGRPRDIYNDPNSRFGGWFLGNPGMNFVDYTVNRDGEQPMLNDPLFAQPTRISGLNGDSNVVVGIRPERVTVYEEPMPNSVEGTVLRSSVVVGGQHLMTIQIGDVVIKAKVPYTQNYEPGTTVYVECPLDYVSLFAADGHRLETELAY